MIPYHGTPIGGRSVDKAAFYAGRHALVSHYRPDDVEAVAELCRSWVIDNGAFSAWRKGEPIKDWRPYYEFCKKWLRHPGCEWAIIPDVIDGTEHENDMQIAKWMNWDGWRTVKAETNRWHQGEQCVPVWHMHESIERLVRLAQGWNRIAIGSSGQYATVGSESWTWRIHEAFEAICVDGQPICKVHGLRMMNAAVFHRFPFASVDSTNAAQNGQREGVKCGVSDLLGREIIAQRIEKHNSAATYVPRAKQASLIFAE